MALNVFSVGIFLPFNTADSVDFGTPECSARAVKLSLLG